MASQPVGAGQPNPQSAVVDHEFVSLPHKPSVQMAVRWLPAHTQTPKALSEDDILIVFLNGMMTTMPTWTQTIEQFSSTLPSDHKISMLCYDRYGQGVSTDHDPADALAEDPSHGHDVTSSVQDLNQLIHHFSGTNATPGPKVILVANSIGCAIARLYAQTYPGSVAGLILLDSIVRDADPEGAFPDPDDPSFDLANEPEGVTVEDLRKIRAILTKMFSPVNGSREGLSRRTLKKLLPLADGPKLIGWPGQQQTSEGTDSNLAQGPYVTVVGHGFEEFARQSAVMAGAPVACTMGYQNPFWWKYNEGLAKTTDFERSKGPIEAIGAGHFIQRDRPDLVATELAEIVSRVSQLTQA